MDVQYIREMFPSLRRQINGCSIVYLDGPAGTQVPEMVIEAISDYYRQSNANTHGHFQSSKETDLLIDRTRRKVADFLGATGPETISFGQNMTTLNYSLSRALVRQMKPGDQVWITQLDHEANRGPWIRLKEQGIEIKEIPLGHNGTLDLDQFEEHFSDRAALVCMGLASNLFGTVNDISRVRRIIEGTGAKLLLDAVHYAPHFSIDVQALDCDFLLCSAYKFYGPHVGILYTKPGLLETLDTDHLRTQDSTAPYRIETGTLNHAAIAGVEAAVDFIGSLGKGSTLRAKIVDAMTQIHGHEMLLAHQLVAGLQDIKGVELYGPSIDQDQRAPTIAFTLDGATPASCCKSLGEKGICAWDGHFYALRAIEVLDLLSSGGVIRMGVVAYNSDEDVARTIDAVQRLNSKVLRRDSAKNQVSN